jgi:hypothetical protein
MKNTQDKLSPEDLLTSQVADLAGKIARKDVEIADLQTKIYALQIALTYGNPDEVLNFAPDGTIIRTAKITPATPGFGKTLAERVAEKKKRKRKRKR